MDDEVNPARRQAFADGASAAPVRLYRVRAVRQSSRLHEQEIACPNDGEALVRGHTMLGDDYRRVEVWHGERLVCLITRA